MTIHGDNSGLEDLELPSWLNPPNESTAEFPSLEDYPELEGLETVGPTAICGVLEELHDSEIISTQRLIGTMATTGLI